MEKKLKFIESSNLPTDVGEFKVHAFTDEENSKDHLAISMGDLLTNEPLLLPVKTLIIGFLIIPPEISIAAVKVSNFGFVFVPVTIPFIPPIIKARANF